MVTVVEVSLRNGAGASRAFSDVLTGHFQVHAAGIGAFSMMNFEEAADLLQDKIEGPCLVSGRRRHCVAVHRIARPQHDPPFALQGANEWREKLTNLFRAKTSDERQT